MTQAARKAAEIIRKRLDGVTPSVGIVLGSGLGGFVDTLSCPIRFPYAELPGFAPTSVQGHAGMLVVGELDGITVACLAGRLHLYEGHPASTTATLIRTLRLIGCRTLVVTNAAGSLRRDACPGDLMLIRDHINLQGQNPLVGPNDDEFGPRFPAMTDAYDPQLRWTMHAHAETLGIALREGVYVGVLGPSFETPAEIAAFGRLGGDAVGMSTVSEVIVARHCGMRVVAISVLTNLAAGLRDETLDHEVTLQFAHRASANLGQLLRAFLRGL